MPKASRKFQETSKAPIPRARPKTSLVPPTSTARPQLTHGQEKEKKREKRTCRVDNNKGDFEGYGLFQYSIEERLFDAKFDEVAENSFVSTITPDEFTMERLLNEGLTGPLVFRERNPHGMRIPTNLTVDMVAETVGYNTKVEVIHCATQEGVEMTLGQFADYYNTDKKDEPLHKLKTQKIFNLIDLEVSHTSLSDLIDAPVLVRQIDWATNVWPKELSPSRKALSTKKENYPKTQKYILLSKAGSYTDFHIDFGGSSVWYRIVRGKKIFLLIPPTEKNRQVYAQWVVSGQNRQFLGDLVDECERILLVESQTLIIPSGWIHAVYTLDDSLVIGGNFLHSFSGEMQLDIAVMEDSLKVDQKIRYPFFRDLMWLVVERYATVWAQSSHAICRFEIDSLQAIFSALKNNLTTPSMSYSPVADEYIPNKIGLLKKFEIILSKLKAKPSKIFSMNASLPAPQTTTADGQVSEKTHVCKTKKISAARKLKTDTSRPKSRKKKNKREPDGSKNISTQTDDLMCCCPCHPSKNTARS